MILYCEKDYPEFNETLYSLEYDQSFDTAKNCRSNFSIKSIGDIQNKNEVRVQFKAQLLMMKSIIESAIEKIEKDN